VNSGMDFEFYHNDPVRPEARFRVKGQLLDLSTEGMMIQSQHVPRVGTIFSLRTSFRGTPLESELGIKSREFVCQVRWVMESLGKIGVSFIQLSREDEQTLTAALEKISAAGKIEAAY
ncbi:MAG: PilZ domain-containing protein, partial [Bdellovibrionales bacterium]|nr:PilZ domain-containing protein [Bdellovibrionales bacterium]